MISRASGSLSAIRALLFDATGPKDRARRFLSSWAAVRLGGVALVLGGLAGGSSLFLIEWSYYFYASTYNPRIEQRVAALEVVYGVGGLLVAAGLLGLYAAVTKRSRWSKALAGTGGLLAALLFVLFGGALLYLALVRPPYYALYGIGTFFYVGGFLAQPVAVVLLGVAALRTRGLGPWRVLPFLVGLFGSPLVYVLPSLIPFGSAPVPDRKQIMIESIVSSSPVVLAGLGYVFLGLALFGAEKRENALLLRERRATEGENLRKAYRLYDRAFGAGDLSVVDEVVGPDALDLRAGHRGPGGFKRIVGDLRRTFPDLSLTVEGQTAEGDAVTTRCSLSGTDLGGVLWYPPTNRRATFDAAYTDRFVDGRLVEHCGDSDTEGLLSQLGLPGDG